MCGTEALPSEKEPEDSYDQGGLRRLLRDDSFGTART